MIIKPNSFATRLDSLHIELSKLDHKTDSLKLLLSKYSISTDYYHDILTSQVTIFVGIVTVIVALIGLISWGIIALPFQKKEKALYKKIKSIEIELNKTIKEKLNEFSQKIDEQEKLNLDYKNIGLRTFYYINYQSMFYAYACKFALKTAVTYLNEDESDDLKTWLNLANESLLKETNKVHLKNTIADNIESILILKNNKNSDIVKTASEIEENIFKLIYSNKLEDPLNK